MELQSWFTGKFKNDVRWEYISKEFTFEILTVRIYSLSPTLNYREVENMHLFQGLVEAAVGTH